MNLIRDSLSDYERSVVHLDLVEFTLKTTFENNFLLGKITIRLEAFCSRRSFPVRERERVLLGASLVSSKQRTPFHVVKSCRRWSEDVAATKLWDTWEEEDSETPAACCLSMAQYGPCSQLRQNPCSFLNW